MGKSGDGHNVRTFISGAVPSGRSSELLTNGYAMVAAELRSQLEKREEAFVLALAHPSTKERRVVAAPVLDEEPLTPVVVGRHEFAGLSLSADAALSLRHVIVLLGRGPEGGPLARILDLRSGTGMTDASGLPHFSVAADGPLALRVGDCALFLLPWDLPP
ncbi:MAG: hypothetical protein JRI55_18110 [Deltaproteobacteria bacterium]|nr:hypothetical protein [Deltaproteobacteria bacterium]